MNIENKFPVFHIKILVQMKNGIYPIFFFSELRQLIKFYVYIVSLLLNHTF
jgi:hypothetical protein